MVDHVVHELSAAQESATSLLASSLYDAPGGASTRLTGMLALCNETSTLAYGAIQEDDLVARDGTKPWEGKVTTTTESITLAVVRTMCTDAKIRDGIGGKPDLVVMTETLWNVLADILTVQQRYVNSDATARAGFTGIDFEGKMVFPDDYCPSGYAFAVNSRHVGFAIHQNGYFMRSKWRVIPDSPEDRTLKIYWDGNLICNNRKGHIAHSNLS